MSEPSLESNRMPDATVYPGPLQSRHTLFAYNRPGTYTTYCVQRAYGENHCERDLHRRR